MVSDSLLAGHLTKGCSDKRDDDAHTSSSYRQTDRQTHRQTDVQTNTQTDRRMDRQTDRQTDRQRDPATTYTGLLLSC